jgi:hypothetical protein
MMDRVLVILYTSYGATFLAEAEFRFALGALDPFQKIENDRIYAHALGVNYEA